MNRRILLLALAAVAAPAAAELSVTRPDGGGVTFFFEPSPTGPWGRVRPEVPTGDILNVQGDPRADGWPSFALDATGLPSVVHSTAGADGEIMLAWHDGQAWRTGTNLSRQAGADTGPMLVLDQWGNRFVAWNNTRDGRSAVLFSGARADGDGLLGITELTVLQMDPRRPSLAVFQDGEIYVAYEEQSNGNDDVPHVAIDRVRVDREQDQSVHCSGENTADLARTATIRTALTDRAVMADVAVKVEANHLWVTWIDNRTRVGWVELIGPGAFNEPQYVPYDPTEGPGPALDEVRDQVLGP